MSLIRGAAIIGALLSIGCADSTAPTRLVTGTWTHDYQFPGMGFQMTLSAQGNIVSGTGTWSGEACCDGTVSVTGSFTDGLLKLDITQTPRGSGIPPFQSHFEGHAERGATLWGATLSGTLTSSGGSTPWSYQRVR